jgi:serine protease AprX
MVRWKAVWGPKRTLTALMLLALGLAPNVATAVAGPSKPQSASGHASKVKPGKPSSRVKNYKIDDEVRKHSKNNPQGITSVIVTFVQGGQLPAAFKKYTRGSRLDIINGQVLDLPNGLIKQLEANPEVFRVHHNRPIGKDNYRTSVTVGSRVVNDVLGYTGAGVGVAVVDSGIATWHDDLTKGGVATIYPFGDQRVKKFVDFVNGRNQPYDDNGHGSHVAGIVAGNGYDSLGGQKAGIAPKASLVSLKVLDANGSGTISSIIAAFNWVAVNHKTYNIRVVNLSVGAAVTESYLTDPLTLAAKRAVDAGVVVVTAAGNLGKRNGHIVYGGITAPGNAPWVLTVGGSSHQGTVTRTDDTMADYSSRGPTAQDFAAKPDVVAPGTGIVSLSVPGSMLYTLHPGNLLGGSLLLGSKPYLSLTGTSMAAPMVTGTVALMMQANPDLTPNLAKAIIEYTAQRYNYSSLSQGAGFLNTEGAVKLARYLYTAQPGSIYPSNPAWGRTIIWGNRRITSGVIKPQGSAYGLNIVWGTTATVEGQNIVWGTHCLNACDDVVWGDTPVEAANIVWGTFTAEGDATVWGTNESQGGFDNIVWGTACDENGNSDDGSECDNIVWGTDCEGADCAGVVWGAANDCPPGEDCDNIVWGTACEGDPGCNHAVWGTAETCPAGEDCDNIVWGTADDCEPGEDCDNIVWGTAETCPPGDDCDNIVWGTSDGDTPPIYDDPDSPSVFDEVPFESLFGDLFFPPVEQNPPPPLPPAGGGTTPGGGIL